ncbi:ABC transporter permease [Hydrocarboniclastica marina]|uniref:ABC transporter permease n=1 Tax=Hydrocarboniclastica marina TaxID=2259620 RepID=A0A4P7XJR2_9ALTE|nr:ABC transporter permease [Hydrocarboniclastica marina]MAL99377.1 taurine ABC transporter permease [Alteromonadaceae bacterium]QCF26117.1 ABC transporter permease [Hydrocarboniclastica marina]|tara:strand:- start:263 stop:1129 length:867 start_codon:yes stop_codon:yes gene_type:complete
MNAQNDAPTYGTPAKVLSPNRTLRLPALVRKNIENGKYLSVLTVLFLLGVWFLVTAMGWANPLFLPSPGDVWRAFVEVAVSGYQGSTLLEHVSTSLYRILVSFAAACLVGIPLGVLMGTSWAAHRIFNPLIEFYRPLPPLGLYTLLVMWLGIGESSKLALLFLAGLPGIIIATIQAVSDINPTYVRAARSLGAGRWALMRNVYLPGSGPTILTGMRISLGFIYTVLVAAEIVAATAGIGWMIWDAAKFLLGDIVIMGLVVLGITGMALDLVLKFAGRVVMPWTRIRQM